MISDNTKLTDVGRRSALKRIATAGIGSLILGTSSASATGDWTCTTDCSPVTEAKSAYGISDSIDYSREGNASINWYSSDYVGGDYGWLHEFGVSGGAASESDSYTIINGELYGQRYEIQGPDGNILARTDQNYHGVHPGGSGSTSPETWAASLLKTAIGSVSIGASWFFGVTSILRSKLEPAEGFDFGVSNGFGYTNTIDTSAWNHACHYHRFVYTSNLYEPTLDVRSSIANSKTAIGLTEWENVDFTVNPADGGSLSRDVEDPSELSQLRRRALGIERVPDDANQTRTIDGEEHTVKYRATQSPVSNVEVSKSASKE